MKSTLLSLVLTADIIRLMAYGHGHSIDQTEKNGIVPLHPNDLADFGGKGKYHQPQFTWFKKVVPTGIAFLNSNKMGRLYENDMFIADDLNGNIYHFDLNSQRMGLLLPAGPLEDLVANSNDSLDQIYLERALVVLLILK